MIPLSDDNPTVHPPVMTVLLLVAIGVVWAVVQGAGFTDQLVRSVCNLGMVPGELTGRAEVGAGVALFDGTSGMIGARVAMARIASEREDIRGQGVRVRLEEHRNKPIL